MPAGAARSIVAFNFKHLYLQARKQGRILISFKHMTKTIYQARLMAAETNKTKQNNVFLSLFH